MRIIERKPKKELLPRELAGLLPPRLCEAIAGCGAERAEEIRIHAGRLTTVTCGGKNYDRRVSEIIRNNTGAKYCRTIESNASFEPQKNLYEFL